MTIMTSWIVYALVIETPCSERGIFWILVIQIVPCSISMWYDRETQLHKGMTHGPSHFFNFNQIFNLNQRQVELLYGVRSTDWAENPQVACDWFGATVVGPHTSY